MDIHRIVCCITVPDPDQRNTGDIGEGHGYNYGYYLPVSHVSVTTSTAAGNTG
jgi:hypothetical protein